MKFIDEFSTNLKREQWVLFSPLYRKLELWHSLKRAFIKFAAIQLGVIISNKKT